MWASALLLAALGALPTPTAADPPGLACEWAGYTRTNFNSTPIYSSGRSTECYGITNSKLVNDLYSAKVTSGSQCGHIYLFTGSSCTGSKQIIDKAGYRNMGDLPAYHSWAY